MKIIIGIIISSFLSIDCSAQNSKKNNIWMLGCDGGGLNVNISLDFNSGNAVPVPLFRDMCMLESNASICDTNGQILFYTNGVYIADRNNDTLLNSAYFNPTYTNDSAFVGIFNSTLILPHPKNASQYFIIHENQELFPSGNGSPLNIAYSIVDMNLNNGLGGIDSLKKDIHIIDDTISIGALTACQHGNGRDWWVIAHRWQSNIYYKILITADTITVDTQHIGATLTYDGLGQSTFNNDGSIYARLMQYRFLDVMHFDRCTGLFSNRTGMRIPDGGLNLAGIGCAFSKSGKFLYASNNTEIYQYDITASNIEASMQVVAQWDSATLPSYTYFSIMQLAPDNKIYVATWNGNRILHVINNPDNPGTACNVIQNSFFVSTNGYINCLSLPNIINYTLSAFAGSPCDSLTSVESLHNTLNAETFPNPVNNILHVNMDQNTNSNICFTIKDISGQLLNHSKDCFQGSCDIDVSALQNGVYFIELTNNKKQTTSKLFVVSR